MKQVFAEFDTKGICRRVIVGSDPSMSIVGNFIEITDEELKNSIKVNEYKINSGIIEKRTDQEIAQENAGIPVTQSISQLTEL